MSEVATTKKRGMAGMMLAIYAVYFIIPDMGYISPALYNIAQACNVDAGMASYMLTLPSLFQIITAALCAFIAGRYVNYKTLLVIGVTGVFVFGTLPGFMDPGVPFVWLLVIRSFFGLSLGFLMPIVNTAIAKIYSDEDKRAKAMGNANVFFNIGAIFGLLVGGVLASFAWNGSFWLYAISAIVLICVIIGFKEPDHDAEMEAKEKGTKTKIPAIAWFFILMFVVINMCDQPVMSILADVFVNAGIGDAGAAGVAQASFVAAGVVLSLIFGFVFKHMKKWVLMASALVICVGQFVLFSGTNMMPSLAVAIIGIIFIGLGNTGITVGTPLVTSLAVSPAAYAAAMGFSKVGMDIGAFISSPYVQVVTAAANTSDYSIVFAVSGVIAAVCFVLFLVVLKNTKTGSVDEAVLEEAAYEENIANDSVN